MKKKLFIALVTMTMSSIMFLNPGAAYAAEDVYAIEDGDVSASKEEYIDGSDAYFVGDPDEQLSDEQLSEEQANLDYDLEFSDDSAFTAGDPEFQEEDTEEFVEEPEEILIEENEDLSGSGFDDYFLETWTVKTVEYYDGLKIQAPGDGTAFQWYDLSSEITCVVDDYNKYVGFNSVSDGKTIIDGATSDSLTPAFDGDEPAHYYGCVTDTGTSLIYQVYKKPAYIGTSDEIDAGLDGKNAVELYPIALYDENDEYYPNATFRLTPTETGFYEITSYDVFALKKLGGYSFPAAYLYDEDDELIGAYHEGGEDNNFSFTCPLVKGQQYTLELGFVDFRNEISKNYCEVYGTYPVLITYEEAIEFPTHFRGSWEVKGSAALDDGTVILEASDGSGVYQWYDLGTELTVLYDDNVKLGYDSASDNATVITGAENYYYTTTWNNNENVHYYACDTAYGKRLIYEVIYFADVNSHFDISLSTATTIKRNSIVMKASNAHPVFKVNPTVSGTCTLTSEDPYANSSSSYMDPYVAVHDSSGKLVAEDDNGGTGKNFKVSFAVTAGNTYYVNADFVSSSLYGSYPFSITFNPAKPPENNTTPSSPAAENNTTPSSPAATVAAKAATIKANKTKVTLGKKTTIKITTNSGGKVTIKGKSKNAKNKKYVKISGGKLIFQKKAPKGTYKFTVTSAQNGQFKKTTKTISIKVK